MNNNTFVHKYIRPLISKKDTVVDMTAGNGNDTLFLARLAKKVHAFDISETAIKRSKEKTKDFDNIEFHLTSHGNVDRYVRKDEACLFLFNLGYLPGSDEDTCTEKNETLKAFKKAYALLKDKGYLIVTFYLRQKGGYEEYYLLDDYIKKNRFQILETYSQQKMDSPITYIIYKDQSKTEL
ncbi:MAG: methyltransferase domain-containing protein [Erysipelotrichaceae bacterium]|nr:methyltransferase domain-containing protein [Erysipelotrichaceae bacterium]